MCDNSALQLDEPANIYPSLPDIVDTTPNSQHKNSNEVGSVDKADTFVDAPQEEDDVTAEADSDDRKSKCFSINRAMIPSKAVYFFEYAKEGCHWQYLILFYCNIGLTPTQAGLVNGLRYSGSAVAAPLLGLFADKKQCHRRLITFICIMSALINVLQPLTPLLFQRSIVKNVTQTEGDYLAYMRNHISIVDNRVEDLQDGQTVQSNTKLFILVLVVAFLGAIFDGSTLTFGDYGVIRRTTDLGTNVGDQRRLGELGYGVGSMMSSLLIKYLHIPGVSPYAGVFIVYAFVTSALTISYQFLYRAIHDVAPEDPPNDESPPECETNIRKEIFDAFTQFKTWFFFVTIVINGIPLAFAYSFTFVFLADINTDPILFGPSDILNGSMGFIVYSLGRHIVRGVGGTVNGMALSCFFWFIRFMALSYMQASWLLFPINMTNGICCGLFVYTYMQFIAEVYPASIQTTMCGITNALYYSLSYLLANVVGGGLYTQYGPRKLFRVQGIACAVWSVVILMYGFVYRRKGARKVSAVMNEHEMAVKIST